MRAVPKILMLLRWSRPYVAWQDSSGAPRHWNTRAQVSSAAVRSTMPRLRSCRRQLRLTLPKYPVPRIPVSGRWQWCRSRDKSLCRYRQVKCGQETRGNMWRWRCNSSGPCGTCSEAFRRGCKTNTPARISSRQRPVACGGRHRSAEALLCECGNSRCCCSPTAMSA